MMQDQRRGCPRSNSQGTQRKRKDLGRDRKVQHSSLSERENQGPPLPRDSLPSPFLGLASSERKICFRLASSAKSSGLNYTQHRSA